MTLLEKLLQQAERSKLLASIEAPGGEGGGGTSGGGSTPSGSDAGQSSSTPGADSSPAPAGNEPSGGGESSAPSPPQPLPEDPFSGFGATDDEGDEPAPEVAPPKAPAAPKAPEQPAQPQPPAATPPAPAEAPKAPAPTGQPTQPGQEGAAPQLPTPAEPAAMAQAILQNFEQMADHLATTPEFTLSEAEIEAVNNDFVGALPKLAAKVMLRAQISALNQMERVVPAIVQKVIKATEAQGVSKRAFYARWPQIKEAEHGQVVDRLAATYRRENPGATREQMIEALGPYVMMIAKIPASGAAPQAPGPNGHPARRPTSPPFTPAVGGPASIPAPGADDPWSGYGAAPPDE